MERLEAFRPETDVTLVSETGADPEDPSTWTSNALTADVPAWSQSGGYPIIVHNGVFLEAGHAESRIALEVVVVCRGPY